MDPVPAAVRIAAVVPEEPEAVRRSAVVRPEAVRTVAELAPVVEVRRTLPAAQAVRTVAEPVQVQVQCRHRIEPQP